MRTSVIKSDQTWVPRYARVGVLLSQAAGGVSLDGIIGNRIVWCSQKWNPRFARVRPRPAQRIG